MPLPNYFERGSLKNYNLKNCKPRKKLQEVFFKKTVLKNFAIFTGKHLCWSLFIIKLKVFRPEA